MTRSNRSRQGEVEPLCQVVILVTAAAGAVCDAPVEGVTLFAMGNLCQIEYPDSFPCHYPIPGNGVSSRYQTILSHQSHVAFLCLF